MQELGREAVAREKQAQAEQRERAAAVAAERAARLRQERARVRGDARSRLENVPGAGDLGRELGAARQSIATLEELTRATTTTVDWSARAEFEPAFGPGANAQGSGPVRDRSIVCDIELVSDGLGARDASALELDTMNALRGRGLRPIAREALLATVMRAYPNLSDLETVPVSRLVALMAARGAADVASYTLVTKIDTGRLRLASAPLVNGGRIDGLGPWPCVRIQSRVIDNASGEVVWSLPAYQQVTAVPSGVAVWKDAGSSLDELRAAADRAGADLATFRAETNTLADRLDAKTALDEPEPDWVADVAGLAGRAQSLRDAIAGLARRADARVAETRASKRIRWRWTEDAPAPTPGDFLAATSQGLAVALAGMPVQEP